jgi:DNA polymerase-1
MRVHDRDILGVLVSVYVVETAADAAVFADWVRDVGAGWVGVDTETSGLDSWADGWELRLVQFATPNVAFVLDPVKFRDDVQVALLSMPRTVFHNRPFDAAALTRGGFEHLAWDGGIDTQVLAHIADSRSSRDGAVGHGLKALADAMIQPGLSDDQVELKAWARANKVSVATMFATAPTELFEAYAGMDAILTVRLAKLLADKVEAIGCGHLVEFEIELQRVGADIQETGFKIDRAYAEWLGDHLESQAVAATTKLRMLGVDNPNSNNQIAGALIEAGVVWDGVTASGKPSVASDVLDSVDHPVADLVKAYRSANKLRKSYVVRALEASAVDGRCHADIRMLQARTARMSVSNPPLQQLPASDAMIRRMFVADPGMAICAVDYSQIELRVLAALSGEESMIAAIADGVDLHTNAAVSMGVSRKVAKMANFLTVYGGGAGQLSKAAGISMGEATAALGAFGRAFPAVAKYGDRLQLEAKYGADPVVTASGRRLMLDRGRLYSATNYVVQSSARDVLAEAMLMVDEDRVLSGCLLMPVHDELIFQAPIDEAEAWVDRMVDLMQCDFKGVHLAAEGEIYGASWGHGYAYAGTPAAGWF